MIAAIGLIVVVGSSLIWRATSLIGLPDIGEPFDLSAQSKVSIPDEENAFTYYRLAVAKLTPRPSSARGTTYFNWAQISEQERDWYLANVDAIEIWLTGTTKDRALLIQPQDQTTEADSLVIAQRLREMIRLVHLAALRMEAQGDLETAWSYYRGALRMSRHCGTNGSIIERLIGTSMYQATSVLVRAWTDRPNLNRDLLQAALTDVIDVDAMTPSLRENYEAEYFAIVRLLDQRDLTTWNVQTAMKGMARATPPSLKERAIETCTRIARREPVRSRRVLKQVWANWLSAASLSVSDRSIRRHDESNGFFYDLSVNDPGSSHKLRPTELNAWVKSTQFMSLITPEYSMVDKILAHEQSTRAGLIIHLAECLYVQDHGKPPESPEQLIGPYLDALPVSEPADVRSVGTPL